MGSAGEREHFAGFPAGSSLGQRRSSGAVRPDGMGRRPDAADPFCMRCMRLLIWEQPVVEVGLFSVSGWLLFTLKIGAGVKT